MSLIASLPDIENFPDSVYVMHERTEKQIPFHKHSKGQLSYVEGGVAYIVINSKTYVIPARHYFWIPAGLEHTLNVGHSATVLRSVFFYAHDDDKNVFYRQMGIYPITDLLIQMIKYSGKWDGHVRPGDERFGFLKAIKDILPDISTRVLPIELPFTENERMKEIIGYIEENIAEAHTLDSIGLRFGLSNRSVSRLFQATLNISFLQYLKLLRMVKALELMLQFELSLSEIAYCTGYQSVSSFSNTFYQFTRLRPSDFIAIHKLKPTSH